MANALKELFTDIADAIREKIGSFDKISPSDFPKKIKEIEGNGGDYNLKLLEALIKRETAHLPDSNKMIVHSFNFSGEGYGSLSEYSFAGFGNVQYMAFSNIAVINSNALTGNRSLKIIDITATSIFP
jgi:hypothetical protein